MEKNLKTINAVIDTDTCPSAMHMTHTHDNTGKLHVENYTIEEVPLEVFFDVWGMYFDETGIFNHRGGSVDNDSQLLVRIIKITF